MSQRATTYVPHDSADLLLLNIQDVAARLRLSRASVQRLLTSGELPSVRIGRTRRVVLADLQVFVDALLRESRTGVR